ncbi:MAG: heavy-metal-associated domain-containing protein [Cyclobacteriaceae bacterium]|nr:heavy-metal-associated domain-containing protein [Cyclobacteriaceae bacterium]
MKTEIHVENIRCGGCAATIEKEIKNIAGVLAVTVDIEEGDITVDYNEASLLDSIKSRLLTLGYPERGSVQGLSKATSKAKSLVSCAVGKLS